MWSWTLLTAQIFNGNLLIAASYLCNKSLHCVPIKIWIFNKNVKRRIVLKITIVVTEVEVSVTLWGRKNEVKCGVAAWHML